MVLKRKQSLCMPLGKPQKHVVSNPRACVKHRAQKGCVVLHTRRQTVYCCHVATLAKHSAAGVMLSSTVRYMQTIVTAVAIMTT